MDKTLPADLLRAEVDLALDDGDNLPDTPPDIASLLREALDVLYADRAMARQYVAHALRLAESGGAL